MRNFHVRYGLSPWAQAELVFAIELARSTSARLFVWSEDVDHARVRAHVLLHQTRLGAEIETRFCQGDPRLAVHDRESTVIVLRTIGRTGPPID